MVSFYNAVLSMQLRRWLAEPDEPRTVRPLRRLMRLDVHPPADSNDVQRARTSRLRFDVQRDMAFYHVAVGFRNAVEQMQARHGRLDDEDHRWWGFGDLRRPNPDLPPNWWGDDGLAGSRIPRHPAPGAGEAAVELEEPSEGAVA
jgi:hypothetical protein